MTTSSPMSLPHLQGYAVLNEQLPYVYIVTYSASTSTRLCSALRHLQRRTHWDTVFSTRREASLQASHLTGSSRVRSALRMTSHTES